jgi:hypothetical protein
MVRTHSYPGSALVGTDYHMQFVAVSQVMPLPDSNPLIEGLSLFHVEEYRHYGAGAFEIQQHFS